MKRIALLITLASALVTTSCQSTADSDRVGALVSLAISSAERRGVISPEDAADIREAKTIVLPPSAQIDVASGK